MPNKPASLGLKAHSINKREHCGFGARARKSDYFVKVCNIGTEGNRSRRNVADR